MKRLTALHTDPSYINRYIQIRDAKRNPTKADLIACHTHVQLQYVALEEAVSQKKIEDLEADATCNGSCQALRACYDIPTKALLRLKGDLRSAQAPRVMKYCPMCGTTLTSTFDHYLPAVKFPEFAVHALNLVPCCALCNSTKDDDWLTVTGHRQYLHPFSDEVPQVEFLFVDLNEADDNLSVGATFYLSRPQDIDEPLWSIIERHFERLHLLRRYSELSNDEIREILAACSVFLTAGGTDFASFLRESAREAEETFGFNHWRARLMWRMALHPHVGGWIRSQMRP